MLPHGGYGDHSHAGAILRPQRGIIGLHSVYRNMSGQILYQKVRYTGFRIHSIKG